MEITFGAGYMITFICLIIKRDNNSVNNNNVIKTMVKYVFVL